MDLCCKQSQVVNKNVTDGDSCTLHPLFTAIDNIVEFGNETENILCHETEFQLNQPQQLAIIRISVASCFMTSRPYT